MRAIEKVTTDTCPSCQTVSATGCSFASDVLARLRNAQQSISVKLPVSLDSERHRACLSERSDNLAGKDASSCVRTLDIVRGFDIGCDARHGGARDAK